MKTLEQMTEAEFEALRANLVTICGGKVYIKTDTKDTKAKELRRKRMTAFLNKISPLVTKQ